MEQWLQVLGIILGAAGTAILQEVRWRRREKAGLNGRRLQVYERFLTVSDLCYSAAREQAELQRGLNRWNGRSRLAALKATKLDERLPKIQEEIAAALAGVRLYGTPEAVAAAEHMFAAVAAPLLQTQGDVDDQIQDLTTRKTEFVDVVRRESGAQDLATAV